MSIKKGIVSSQIEATTVDPELAIYGVDGLPLTATANNNVTPFRTDDAVGMEYYDFQNTFPLNEIVNEDVTNFIQIEHNSANRNTFEDVTEMVNFFKNTPAYVYTFEFGKDVLSLQTVINELGFIEMATLFKKRTGEWGYDVHFEESVQAEGITLYDVNYANCIVNTNDLKNNPSIVAGLYSNLQEDITPVFTIEQLFGTISIGGYIQKYQGSARYLSRDGGATFPEAIGLVTTSNNLRQLVEGKIYKTKSDNKYWAWNQGNTLTSADFYEVTLPTTQCKKVPKFYVKRTDNLDGTWSEKISKTKHDETWECHKAFLRYETNWVLLGQGDEDLFNADFDVTVARKNEDCPVSFVDVNLPPPVTFPLGTIVRVQVRGCPNYWYIESVEQGNATERPYFYVANQEVVSTFFEANSGFGDFESLNVYQFDALETINRIIHCSFMYDLPVEQSWEWAAKDILGISYFGKPVSGISTKDSASSYTGYIIRSLKNRNGDVLEATDFPTLIPLGSNTVSQISIKDNEMFDVVNMPSNDEFFGLLPTNPLYYLVWRPLCLNFDVIGAFTGGQMNGDIPTLSGFASSGQIWAALGATFKTNKVAILTNNNYMVKTFREEEVNTIMNLVDPQLSLMTAFLSPEETFLKAAHRYDYSLRFEIRTERFVERLMMITYTP